MSRPVDERLRERGLTLSDVRHALAGARVCIDRGDGTHRVAGADLDGAPLSLVVSLTETSVVVLYEVER